MLSSTERLFVLACFYLLPLVLADAAANVTILTEPPVFIDYTITLDDLLLPKLPWYIPVSGFSMNITVEERLQQVTLGGYGSTINRAFTLMDARWDGTKAWPDSNDTFPGLFIGCYATDGDNCSLYFKEPIAQFTARVNAALTSDEDLNSTKSIIQIFDIAGNEISTANVPMLLGINNYTIIGFSSGTPIYSVVLNNAIYSMDDIQWTFYYCKDGYFRDMDGECKDIDECESNPCHPLAKCDNALGWFNCTCDQGYTGDGLGATGCADIDECSVSNSACGSNSMCNNTIGGFECTCNEGLTGDPYKSEGCKATVEPVSPPISSPVVGSPPRPERSTLTSSANRAIWFSSCALFITVYFLV